MEKLKKNKSKSTKGITLEVSSNNRKGENLKKDYKQEKAITLIALVITVIVLIILARHFYQYAIAVITVFWDVQQMQK